VSTVFISYRQTNEEQRQRVRAFAVGGVRGAAWLL